MTEEEFWALISLLDREAIEVEPEDDEEDPVTEPLVKALVARGADAIKRFDDLLSGFLYELDGQAFVNHAGVCGEFEDLFLYCRCVAVASGREAYETILHDPTFMPTDLEFEPLASVAERAWRRLGQGEYRHEPSFSLEMRANQANWPD
ncbi:MAG: DUF4240 domain-containing protein [Planctomycetes bacterium]|nr:DUF4240 domain-containing protein [Planctomycetota bacterium]